MRWAICPSGGPGSGAARTGDTGRKSAAAAQRKYGAGYADFLIVTDAERSLYTARDQLADIRRARLAASVALFKALGGGYQLPDRRLRLTDRRRNISVRR